MVASAAISYEAEIRRYLVGRLSSERTIGSSEEHQASLDTLNAHDGANRIDPDRLNKLDRRSLKEAFQIVRDLQSRLALDYQL